MKKCIHCGKDKPLEDFYTHPGMADGRLNVCIECKRLDQRKYARTEAGRAYERNRNKKPKRIEYLLRHAKNWTANNPDGYKAHNAISNAIRDKKITKPSQCEECGATGVRIEAHHDDYSKPLEVKWLCKSCHGRRVPHYVGLSE